MVVELEATDLCKERRNSRRCNPVPYSGATAMRTKVAYVGRGVLNLVVVLAVVFGLQPLIRGRVSDTLGLIALSSVLVVSYVAGVRWGACAWACLIHHAHAAALDVRCLPSLGLG